MRKTKILLAALAAGLVLVLLTGSAVAQDASINTEAQAIEEGGTVTIDSLDIDDDGWVAVYEESITGGPDFDGLVGATQIDSGSHSDIEVETDIQEDGFYYAVLHYDESESSEFDYPNDPVVELNGTQVQDYMFVTTGTGEEYQTYADANQQKRELENQLEDLRRQVNEFERRGGENGTDEYDDEIQSLRDEIENIEQDIETLDSTIQERKELLQQLEEAEQQAQDGMEDGGDGGTDGNGTDDSMDGNGTEDGDGGTDDSEEPEGLPGFTVVAALVAVLTGGALLRRNRE